MRILTIERFLDNVVDHLHLHLSFPVDMPDGEKGEVHMRGGAHLFIFDNDKKLCGALDANDILHVFDPNGKILKR